MKHSLWWMYSAIITTVLVIVLIIQWISMNQLALEPSQMVSEADAMAYLETNWDSNIDNSGTSFEDALLVKTGIFIQSLEFFNSTEVNLTGYIWQKFEDGIHDEIKPVLGETGFILPEQIDSGNTIEPREAYRLRQGNTELIGWYFESTLRQPFEYDNYPFDHKNVWVRLWPRDFYSNVLLIPDYDSYDATGLSDIFGIEKDIVMGTWERKNTYFDYELSSYDTNFGVENFVGQLGFPELHYNFIIKRKFENAFIIYLLPLFLVASLLFAALLTVSNKEDLSLQHGFDTNGFIAASSALFFVIMLSHIQLREQFADNSIVYIEYFYILMYGILVLATANTYLFRHGAAPWLRIIHYSDNIIPKLAYWPILLLGLISITYWTNSTYRDSLTF